MRKAFVFVLVFVILFFSFVSAQLNESLNASLGAGSVKDKTNEVLAKENEVPESWKI